MVHRILTGAGATRTVTALTAVGLACALASCASVAQNPVAAGAGGSGSEPAQSPSPVGTSPSPTGSSTVNPGGPMHPGVLSTPQAQVQAVPTGAKLVPIGQVDRSADGRTLYLQVEAQGGACGRYDVVLQESADSVQVGLAHLPVRVGVMCPMLVHVIDLPAVLAGPLGDRPVIDLATGESVGVPPVIPSPLPPSAAALPRPGTWIASGAF